MVGNQSAVNAAEAHFARRLALADQLGADATLAAALTGPYLGVR